MRRRERKVVEVFRTAHAVSPASARPLAELGIQDERTLKRLRDRVVIREGSPGRYYLDEEVWTSLHRERHRIAAALAVVMFAVALAGAVLAIALSKGH